MRINKTFCSFILYMETVVENNLAAARRGGNPTMLSLIDAFLNVKHLKPTQRHTQVSRSISSYFKILFFYLFMF